MKVQAYVMPEQSVIETTPRTETRSFRPLVQMLGAYSGLSARSFSHQRRTAQGAAKWRRRDTKGFDKVFLSDRRNSSAELPRPVGNRRCSPVACASRW